MRATCCALATALALGLATVASAEHHEKQQALMEEVTRIGDDLARAMVENDVDHMLAMYAPGAISLPNYGPRMEGIEAFRQSHEQMSAAGMKVLAFDSQPTEVWQAGDQVIEIGTFKIRLEMPGPPAPIEDVGKYLTIYERDAEGALKIKVETWNTDMNPMQMMGGMAGGQEGSEVTTAAEEDRDEPEDADRVP